MRSSSSLVAVVVCFALACAQGTVVDESVATGAGGLGGGSTVASNVGGSISLGGSMNQGGAGALGGGGGHVGGEGGAPVAQACPPSEYATGISGGVLQCAPLGTSVHDAVNANCSIYAGWRDSCNACVTSPGIAPGKWGRVDGTSCTNGLGADSTCTVPSLGSVSVQMFGLNTDGDVDDDDKFHYGLYCTPPAETPSAGPCAAGEFVSGVSGSASVECVSPAAAVVDYMREDCRLYVGWRDSCDGCTSAPLKWGYVNSTTCNVGSGTNSSCITPTLGGQAVPMLGLNVDGDVDGNDKFYFGLVCTGAAATTSSHAQTCPAGQLVVGIDANGMVQCASPALDTEATVRSDCWLYAGWRDSCDGCVTSPGAVNGKWGRVSTNTCENGVGADSTCAATPLDAQSIQLFGLNTDGNVNGDDKFYYGLRCLP